MERLQGAFERFEAWASPKLAAEQVPGCIVALAQDGELVYTHGFGYADVEQRRPITEETVFGIGSVTKSFTALAIMQLVEAGKLSVSDPVNQYLPKFRTSNVEYSQATTVHHLLTHTAGLALYNSEMLVATETMNEQERETIQPLIDAYGAIGDTDDLIAFIANSKFKPVGAPGEQLSYSNDGYALLGRVIERVTDMPYVDYVKQNILDAAGMTRTVFLPESLRKLDNVATLYSYESDEAGKRAVASPNWWYSPVHFPSGIFLNSCVRDMIRYLEIFRLGGTVAGTRIVSEHSVQQILSQHAEILPAEFYGYGMSVHPAFFGQTLYEHGGGAKGVSSQVCIVPDSGLTAVAFANVGGAPSSEILHGAIHALQGRNPESPLNQASKDRNEEVDSALGKYVGAYVNGDQVSKVEWKDGKLMFEGLGLNQEIKPTTSGLTAIDYGGIALTGRFFYKVNERDVNQSQDVSGFNVGLRHFIRVS